MSADPMIREWQKHADTLLARAEAAEVERDALRVERDEAQGREGNAVEAFHRAMLGQEAAEAELAQARELLFNFVEFYDMIEVGGPDDGQSDREFVVEMVGHREAARAALGEAR